MKLFFRALVFILFEVMITPLFAQRENLKFDHIGREEGLSQVYVKAILQDSKGFLWFGTLDGLNKYDGYKIKIYKNNRNDKNSLSSSDINDIFEDSKGNIWIATTNGLNKFNIEKENFTHFNHNKNDPNSISSNSVTSIAEDKDKNLWIGCGDATSGKGGLNFFDVEKKQFKYYGRPGDSLRGISVNDIFIDNQHNLWIAHQKGVDIFDLQTRHFSNQPTNVSLAGINVTSFFEDSNSDIWIATRGAGLNRLNIKTKQLTTYKHKSGNTNSLATDVILSLAEDSFKNLWIGTDNGGLSVLDITSDTFYNYVHEKYNLTSLHNNSIQCLFKDAKGSIWLGTAGGVDFVDFDTNQFIHFKESSAGLNSNVVFCIREGSDGNLLLATDGGGVNIYDKKTGTFSHLRHQPGNKNSICGDHVISVLEDSYKNIWVGTWGDGLTVYNRERNTYKHYKHDPADPHSLGGTHPWVIFEDSRKNIWIGTYWGGLSLYDRKNDKFIRYQIEGDNSNSISSNVVTSLFEDSKGNLLIGTLGGGLCILDVKTGNFTTYLHDPNKNSLIDNNALSISEDSLGNLWIGTMVGLDYFDRQTNTFIHLSEKNGFANNVIKSILSDDKNNLWISTSVGISKFNTITKEVKNFEISKSWESLTNSYLKSSSGELYSGGMDGFVRFIPDSVNEIPYDPPIVFTSFQIFNDVVPISDEANPDSPLKKSISETSEITISYKESVISFEFASLNYVPEQRKRYSYQLEGFDKDWNNVGTKNTATYTNLDPGRYVLKVRGIDNEGNWSEKSGTIILTITPPIWGTWWFRTSFVLLFLGSGVFFYKSRMNAIEAQKNELEKQVKERTNEVVQQKENLQNINQTLIQQKKEILLKQEEAEQARADAEKANQAKGIFLATMSHEIRTPLNGVIGMASLLSETPLNSEQFEYTETIKSCGENLLGVINDILDYSKIESGKMELEEKDFDLRTCIEEVLDVFAGKATQIGLDLIYQIDYNIPSQILGDSLRLRQVLMNLVGNAVKFTQRGEVYIGVHLLESAGGRIKLGFEVRDTGIGIPSDKINRLFKAFSQVDSSTTRNYGGTGLGLVICEKLVGLMGGQIQVESQVDVGTTFTFNINAGLSIKPSLTYVHHSLSKLEGKRILIVDDNSTNLSILKTQMETWKLIPTLANGGEQAIETFRHQKFDLVITDLQMPGMDGFELAKLIKSTDINTPIILLSSIGDDDFKSYPTLFSSVLTKPVRHSTLCRHILAQFNDPENTLKEEAKINTKLDSEFASKYPLNILISEDNPINLVLADRLITKLGYRPDKALNGKEALMAAEQKEYDIILMDVQMPEMDGMEATHKIRLLNKPQPIIIAMTANAMAGDKESCLAAGMDDYISKPVRIDTVIEKLEKYAIQLGKHG